MPLLLFQTFLKYLTIFGLGFIPLVAFNVLVSAYLDNWLVIFLDCVIMLTIALIGNLIAKRIFEKKDAKLNAKIKAHIRQRYPACSPVWRR